MKRAVQLNKLRSILTVALADPETWTCDINDDGNINSLDITRAEILLASS